MAYVGQTRSRKLIAQLTERGHGEMTQPWEYPPRRTPWALDNGAFADWKNRRPFNAGRFVRVALTAASSDSRPDFLVVPDIVAGGLDSLRLSLAWADVLEPLGLPLALVVQDGMQPGDIAPHLGRFSHVFVGGSLKWKIATGAQWVRHAHVHGLRCHLGRVGTRRRVMWAKRIGADSIDSCLPLWSADNLATFELGLNHPQLDLFT